jgi:hypothetical protein
MSAMTNAHMQGGAVRLTLPARVANDLDTLQSTLRDLAERMGHPQCASGCDTLFIELEREFSVSEAVELNPQPIPPGRTRISRLIPDPQPWRVEAVIPERVASDIDSLQKAIATTLGRLGCAACCSGFDIAFRREYDMITIDENIEARGFGRFR